MKTIIYYLSTMLFLLSINSLKAQTVEWVWAKSAGGSGSDAGEAIIADKNGNLFTAGTFEGTASFGSFSLKASGSNSDVYLAKYNSLGIPLWVISCTGTSIESIGGIALDKDGNLYISGSYSGSMNLGKLQINARGGSDIYVAKFNSSGNVIWAKTMGSTDLDISNGVAINGTSIYITGSFSGQFIAGSDTVKSKGNTDICLVKMDSAGNHGWLKSAGGKKDENPCGIAASADLVFITGQFCDSTYFENILIKNQKYSDIYTAAYGIDGKVKWVKTALGDYGDYPNAICADNLGNVYITGTFGLTVKFDNISLTSSGYCDLFIAKYDSKGDCIWAKREGGNSYDQGLGIYIDDMGCLGLTGFFSDNMTIGGITLNEYGANDIFIAEYGSDGSFKWANSAGGINWDLGKGICKAGNAFYATGYFDTYGAFGSTTFNLSSNGQEIFICKIGVPAPPSIVITLHPKSQTICENEDVTFIVAASGKYLKYQWKFNNNPIPDTRDSFLSVLNCKKADAGKYSCEIWDSTFNITSDEAILIVGTGPAITTQPVNKTVMKNKSVSLSLVATGINLTYQWKKNGIDIGGATTSTFTINSVSYADSGTYTCIITDKCGILTSEKAYLTVTNNSGIEEQSNRIIVFPNPATDKLFIQTDNYNRNDQVSLFDMDGHLVLKSYLETNNQQLNLENIAPGLYNLRIEGSIIYSKNILIH